MADLIIECERELHIRNSIGPILSKELRVLSRLPSSCSPSIRRSAIHVLPPLSTTRRPTRFGETMYTLFLGHMHGAPICHVTRLTTTLSSLKSLSALSSFAHRTEIAVRLPNCRRGTAFEPVAGMIIRKSDDCVFDSDLFKAKKMQGEIHVVTREKTKKEVSFDHEAVNLPKEKEKSKLSD